MVTKVSRQSGVTLVVLGVALAVSLSTFAVIAFLPQAWVARDEDRPDAPIKSITLLHPSLARLLGGVGLGCLCVLLALGLFSVFRRAIAMALVVFLGALLCPMAGLVSFVRTPAPWQIQNELEAPDGSVYCFAESSFLQGQTLMLARVREKALLTCTIEPLVITNGDNPRSYLRIVRPSGAADTYGQLYLTEDNWLLGLRTDNRFFFAYDLKAAQPYGHGAVEKLSPFLGLGEATVPHEPDVASLLAVGVEREKGAPTRAAVLQGLSHPNPRVRAVASELLEKR